MQHASELAKAAALLDALAGQKESFAAYREPGQNEPTLLAGEERPFFLKDLGTMRDGGFVLVPFASEALPGAFIAPKTAFRSVGEMAKAYAGPVLTVDGGAEEALLGQGGDFGAKPSEAYQKAFGRFIQALKEGRFAKLVLSRSKEEPLACSPGRTFFNACRAYPNAMVTLTGTRAFGTWLGASPEILLAGEGSLWRTMALAGTRPVEEQAPWDEKNVHEQAIVASYIQKTLEPLVRNMEQEGPYTSPAGKICHLRTDFRFTPVSQEAVAKIAEGLHPTPAVCGLPKEGTREFILENEGRERSIYSGFLGPWNPGTSASLYVNLRCVELFKERVVLHAGGGILPASELGSEWRETCLKMRTMLSVLAGTGRE